MSDLHDLRYDLPEWHLQAACRGMDPMLFFPVGGGSTRGALETCAACPVQEECREFALALPETESLGIWGGTTRRERRAIRKGRPYERKRYNPQFCTICGDPAYAYGWCEMHYGRWRRSGDPEHVQQRGRKPTIDMDRLLELSHLSQAEAAKELGVHHSTVYYWRARLAESPDARGSVSGDRQ